MKHGRAGFGLLVAVAACAAPAVGPALVRPGIEVLLADSAHLIRGRRIGLLTNQTGVDRGGVDDLTRLLGSGAQVSAIFSPEHGYRGFLDEENIGHGVDSATGIPIYSLYGATRAPTAQMLAAVDVLVIDLQDIGARPYTYISTALGAMRAARAHRVAVVVLDRPNPIGGALVQGPVLDTAFASFVGMLPIPLRHGMTLGELARFGNARLGIGADLAVVPAAGWTREAWFDATGLPWIRPSPSMPDLESATHYPGLVLFEATNLSVGRGTPVAFQVVGAPWLDAGRVTAATAWPPGVVAADTVIRPDTPPDGKYGGVTIPAVRLRVTDRTVYDPIRAAVALFAAVRAVHGDSLAVRPDRFDRLAGTDALRRALEAGRSGAEISAGWNRALARFRADQAPHLLYSP